MLRDLSLDCVHVLVPPDGHYSLAKAALQSGVHVFLEKPMWTYEADELLALARGNGLRLGVNHNFLYADAYQHLREVVRSRVLGPLDHVSINHFFELGQIRFGPFDSWMLRVPGNVILEIGPHLLSALLDLVGTPDDISAAVDRRLDLPGGAYVFRRWRFRLPSRPCRIGLGAGF
jgi:predicted dehydrogenase